MTRGRLDIVIAGGGLAGCLAALALARMRPELSVLLVEADERFGGNHIWSFFDGDVDGAHRWLVDPLVSCRWDAHEVRFPGRRRRLGAGYNSIRSDRLHQVVRETLRPDQYRLGGRIEAVTRRDVRLEGGERIAAAAILDARGASRLGGLDLGWQKFTGLLCRCEPPHHAPRPVIMDAEVDQADGYRFVYTLPFSPSDILIEDTYYSTSPALDPAALRARIASYAEAQGWKVAAVLKEESGVLPVALGGRIAHLWAAADGVAQLGLRGGFFHPTTGYSLPDAVRNAALLTEQRDLTTAALHQLFRARAAMLWKERGFYRLLNRMLMRGAAPDRRYRVLEHFYRLPEPVIARFYAGRSTALDKARILSGKPPVPVRRALTAALGAGA